MLQPRMSEPEIERFRQHLDAASNYVEFGCGGSTYMALSSPVKRIWSTESDPAWVEKLQQEPPIQAALKEQRLHFFCPDLGKVGHLGRLDQEGDKASWHRYHADVWRSLDSKRVDLVLIDGRFRIACALQAALRVRADCPILIHDYGSRRRKYAPVLEFLSLVDEVDTLATFHIKRPRQVARMVDQLFTFIQEDRR